MAYTYSDSITLETIECCNCGITFAVPDTWKSARRKDHAWFYCPNGHTQHYSAQTEEEKLKKQVEKEQREAFQLRERAVVAERAQKKAEKSIARLKKRSAAGVCPCCNRTFEQLAAHMQSKHKEFRELQGLNPPKQLTGEVQ